jgi:outer membrane biosynthesis protein TonB
MSGGIGFDPSREWLGIDAVDLADPFRVLGLAVNVSDPAVVTAAAGRLLEKLHSVDPGPFKRAHEALVRRIETSRDEVLATIAARAPRFNPPPPPAGLATPTLAPASPSPWSPPPPPRLPAGMMTADPASPLAPAAEADVIHVRRSARVRRKSPSVVPTLLSLIALAAVGVAAYRFWPQPGAMRSQGTSPVAVVLPRPEQPAPAPSQPPTAAAATPATKPPPAVPPTPMPPVNPPSLPPTNDTPAPESQPQPPPPPSQPEPPPTPPQPDPQARARTAAAIDKALRAAYEAIRAGEFDTADRQVAAAAKLAEEDDQARRVTSWLQFTRYARQAADYREQALDAANAGGDYDIGKQRIAVVESTPERFVYHKDGRNVRISPRTNVPPPIVTAILRAWFAAADRPGNHVFLGTYLLARSEPNARLAAAEWNLAGQRGEDVSNLEPLLKDPIIRGVAAE